MENILTVYEACESLFTALTFLDMGFDPRLSNDGDEIQSVAKLFQWASKLALPSSEFATSLDGAIEETPGTCIYVFFQTLEELT